MGIYGIIFLNHYTRCDDWQIFTKELINRLDKGTRYKK